MSPIQLITSKDNTNYRFAKSLHDRKIARAEGLVFLEGVRLCEDALLSHVMPQMVFCTQSEAPRVEEWGRQFNCLEAVPCFCLPDFLFSKLCSTQNPQGIVIIAASPLINGELPIRGRDMYLVCEDISDPGNLGAMIRMADAFDFSAVLVVDGTVDPFNEKTLRAAMGSCFHIPIVFFKNIEEINFVFKKQSVQWVVSDLAGTPLPEVAFSFPAALSVGNEARGISRQSKEMCDIMVTIPMHGQAESLNVSSAASIVGYVLSTQRATTTT